MHGERQVRSPSVEPQELQPLCARAVIGRIPFAAVPVPACHSTLEKTRVQRQRGGEDEMDSKSGEVRGGRGGGTRRMTSWLKNLL